MEREDRPALVDDVLELLFHLDERDVAEVSLFVYAQAQLLA